MADKCYICKNGIGKGKKHLVDLDTGKKMHISCYKDEHGKLPANIKHISYNPADPEANLIPQLRRAGAKFIKGKNPLTEQQKEKVREFAKYVAKGKSANPAGEATVNLSFDIKRDAIKRALKLVGVKYTPDNITKLLAVLEGTADIDIEYNLDTPEDVIAKMWDSNERTHTHPYSKTPKKQKMKWITGTVSEDALVEALKKLGKDVNYNNKMYLLSLLQASADMKIVGDLEDKGTLNDRWPHTVPIKANPGLKERITGAKKLTKEQLSKLLAMADKMPVPSGFDAYFESKIWPKVRKIGKGVIMGGSIAALISPVTSVPALVTIIGRNTKKIKKLEAKKFDQLHKALKYTMGRMLGVSALYVANGYNYKKTLADLQGARNPLPRVSINWEKLVNGKVIAAAISLADAIAGLFYMSAAGTVAGGTAGAAAYGVGAAAGAPAGGTAGVTVGAIKGAGEVLVSLGLFISSMKGAVVLGNPKGLGETVQSVGAYLKTPEGQKTAERAIKLGKNVFEYASKALAKANPNIMDQVKEFLATPEGKQAVQRAVEAGKEVIPYAIEILKGSKNPSKRAISPDYIQTKHYTLIVDGFTLIDATPERMITKIPKKMNYKLAKKMEEALYTKLGSYVWIMKDKDGDWYCTNEGGKDYYFDKNGVLEWRGIPAEPLKNPSKDDIRAGIKDEAEGKEKYLQWADEFEAQGQKPQAKLMRQFAGDEARHGQALDIMLAHVNPAEHPQFYVKAGQDIASAFATKFGKDPGHIKVEDYRFGARLITLEDGSKYIAWLENELKTFEPYHQYAKEQFRMNPRTKPDIVSGITKALKQALYAFEEQNINMARESRAYAYGLYKGALTEQEQREYMEQLGGAPADALKFSVDEWDEDLVHEASNEMSSAKNPEENPRKKTKKDMRRTPLTADEYATWEFAIVFYLNEGQSDARAYKSAWNDTKLEHPRLGEYDDVDWQVTNKSLGLNVKTPKSNPLTEITYKVPMMKAEEMYAAIRSHFISNGINATVGTDAYYQDPNKFMTIVVECSPQHLDSVRDIAKQYDAIMTEETNPNPAKGTIAIRELSDKPGRYIVVEEIGETIVQLLSGVAGQSKAEAEEIAQRIRKRNPARRPRWKKGGVIQSMRFKKSKWSPSEAQHWLRSHGFKAPEVDETKSELRYRQISPSKIKSTHYGSKPFGKKPMGIRALFGEPNPAETLFNDCYEALDGKYCLRVFSDRSFELETPSGMLKDHFDQDGDAHGIKEQEEDIIEWIESIGAQVNTRFKNPAKKRISFEYFDGVVNEIKGLPEGWEFEVYDDFGWTYGGPEHTIKEMQAKGQLDADEAMTESFIDTIQKEGKTPIHDKVITIYMTDGIPEYYNAPAGYTLRHRDIGDNSEDKRWYEVEAQTANPSKAQANKIADEHRASGKRARVFPIKGGYSAYVDGPRANPQSRANIESAIFSRMELARIHHSRKQFKAAQDIVSQALGLYHALNTEEMEQFNEYWPAYRHLMSKPVSKWTPKDIENSLITTRGRGQNNPGNPSNPTKSEAQASAEAARTRGKRARVLKTADNYSPFISKDTVPTGKKAVVPKKKIARKVKKAVVPKPEEHKPAPEAVVPKLEAKVEKAVEKTEIAVQKAEDHAEKAVEKNEDLMVVTLPDPPSAPRYTPYDFEGTMTAAEYREQFKAPNKALAQWNAAFGKLYTKIDKQRKKLASGAEERKVLEKSMSDLNAVRDSLVKSFNGASELLWEEEKAKIVAKAQALGYNVPQSKAEELAQVIRSDVYDDRTTKTDKPGEVLERHLKRLFGGPGVSYTIALQSKTGFTDNLTTFNDYDTAVQYLYKKAKELLDESWIRAKIFEKAGTQESLKLEVDLAKIPEPVPTEGKLKISDIPKIVRMIMPEHQQKVIKGSEEFWGIIKNLQERALEIPAIYAQDGKGDEAIVYLHYFYGGSDWFITEWDSEDEFFGFAVLNQDTQNAELGYIQRTELTQTPPIELDFHWRKKTLKEAKKKFEEAEERERQAREKAAQIHEPLVKQPGETELGLNKDGNKVYTDKDENRYYIETSPVSGLTVRQRAPRVVAPTGKAAPYTAYELYKQGRTSYLTVEELAEFDEKYKEKEPEPPKPVPPPPPLETYAPSPAAPPPAKPEPTAEELADIIAKKIKEQLGE